MNGLHRHLIGLLDALIVTDSTDLFYPAPNWMLYDWIEVLSGHTWSSKSACICSFLVSSSYFDRHVSFCLTWVSISVHNHGRVHDRDNIIHWCSWFLFALAIYVLFHCKVFCKQDGRLWAFHSLFYNNFKRQF